MRMLLGIAFLWAGACATLRTDTTVCPEHRNLRCATEPECKMDSARSCRVCRCSPASELTVPPPESATPPE